MRVVYEYSHLGGSEILRVRYPDIDRQINEVIVSIKALKLKKSKEKNIKGKMLYSPKHLNKQFTKSFNKLGFSEVREYYTIKIPNSKVKIKGSYKQIDFVKGKILVEVQFGKYPFMFYDIAKFQYFFNENKADVGVEIVPCHALQQGMSSGVSYGEHLVYDIERLKRHFPAVPVKVLLIDIDPQIV